MQNVFDPDQAPKRQDGGSSFVIKNVLPYLNSALILITLIIIVFSLRARKEPVLQTPTSDVPLTVAVQSLNDRMEVVDKSLEAVREEIQNLAKDQFEARAEKESEIEDVMDEVDSKNVVTPQMGAKLAASTKPVTLSKEKLSSFDELINGDNDNGYDVKNFLSSLEDPAEKSAYLKVLQKKGDAWFNSALKLLKSGDKAGADKTLETAKYFYNAISESGDSDLLSSHVAAKLSQYDLEVQRQEMQEQISAQKNDFEEQLAAATQKAQEETEKVRAELEAKTAHKETATEAAQRLEENRMRNSGIKPYKGTHPKKYQTDWDPDPRVREQRGIIQENERGE